MSQRSFLVEITEYLQSKDLPGIIPDLYRGTIKLTSQCGKSLYWARRNYKVKVLAELELAIEETKQWIDQNLQLLQEYKACVSKRKELINTAPLPDDYREQGSTITKYYKEPTNPHQASYSVYLSNTDELTVSVNATITRCREIFDEIELDKDQIVQYLLMKKQAAILSQEEFRIVSQLQRCS